MKEKTEHFLQPYRKSDIAKKRITFDSKSLRITHIFLKKKIMFPKKRYEEIENKKQKIRKQF